MADNVTIPATGTGSTTPVIATDDVGGIQYQRVKLDLGGDGLTVPVVTAIPVSSPGLSGGIQQTVTTLTNATTAYPVPATPLAGRAALLVQAAETNTAGVWIGKSTVTADSAATGGILLMPGQSIPMQLAAAVILYAASTAAGQKVKTLEMAA